MGNSSSKANKEYIDKYIDLSYGVVLNLAVCSFCDDDIGPLCEYLMDRCKNDTDPTITSLNITNNQLTPKGIVCLLDYLKEDKTIATFQLTYDSIDNSCLEALGNLLSVNNTLQYVSIGGRPSQEYYLSSWFSGFLENKITDEGIVKLSTTLKSNTSLRILNMDHMNITEKSIQPLCDILNKTRIERINSYGLHVFENKEVLKLLRRNRIRNGPKNLDLSKLAINDGDVEEIMKEIKEYCKEIEILNLSLNQLTSKGLKILFDSLIDMKKLQFIDLSGNDADDECIPSLANFIEKSESKLSISFEGYDFNLVSDENFDFVQLKETTENRKLTDKAIEILHPVLVGNVNIKALIFENQIGITDKSVPLLKEIAEQSACRVELYWTSISTDNYNELQNLFNIPVESRSIPVKSSTKSAAKR